jgi:hypothetical protein
MPRAMKLAGLEPLTIDDESLATTPARSKSHDSKC